MPSRASWGLCVLFLFGAGVCTAQPALNGDHPERYVVQPGDTLWDISGRFLRDPWRWKEIWEANPQVQNPDRIYPGDVLVLKHTAAGPRVALESRGQVIKLSPQVRVTPLPRPIPTIPLEVIRPFLVEPLVFNDKGELNGAAYVVANTEGRLVTGTGDSVYVKGVDEYDGPQYSIFRPGKVFRDWGRREILGYEAVPVADAELVRSDDEVSKLKVLNAFLPVHPGDRVLPASEKEQVVAFIPEPPSLPVEGRVISIPSASRYVGRYQVVVVSLGLDDGVQEGDVLATYTAGMRVNDPVRPTRVNLPQERSGLVMLFRIFDRVSYGLVMEAQRDIAVGDVVTNPE